MIMVSIKNKQIEIYSKLRLCLCLIVSLATIKYTIINSTSKLLDLCPQGAVTSVARIEL